jgi:DnaK suppressor protein
MPEPAPFTPAQAEAALRARLAALGVHHDRILRALTREGEALADEHDSDERPVLLEAEAILERLETHEREELAHIRAALDRIAAGTWGRCTRCGATIAPGRLAALPGADRCATCAA